MDLHMERAKIEGISRDEAKRMSFGLIPIHRKEQVMSEWEQRAHYEWTRANELEEDNNELRTQLALAEQQRDAAVEGLENIDTYKLNMLAEWIDLKTQDNPDKEVQSDLRAWARSIDDTLARIREMGSQGWAKAAEAEAEIERLREIQRVQVKNLLLSVEGSWQAFGYEIREAIGNTNYNLIAENANELRAALGSDQALAPKETTDE